MERFNTELFPDIRDNNMLKNVLFVRRDYSANVILNTGRGALTVPDLIHSSNPMRGKSRYYITLIEKPADEHSPRRLESSIPLMDSLVKIEGNELKFSSSVAVDKAFFLEHSLFSLFVEINEKKFIIDIPREFLLKHPTREEGGLTFFPESGSIPLSALTLTELVGSGQVGQISSQIFDQRVDETNEKLVIYLYHRVLNSKLRPENIKLGFRLLVALGALSALVSDSEPRRPFKGIDCLRGADSEFELIEAFVRSLYGAPSDPMPSLVTKNVGNLVSDPTKSFMLQMFAFTANEMVMDKMKTANSIFTIRSFTSKDYLLEVFNAVKEGVFQKIAERQVLDQKTQDIIVDVMMAWSSVKISAFGRFWKGRLLKDFFSNCLMSYHVKDLNLEIPNNSDSTEESNSVGAKILQDCHRYLKQRLAFSTAFERL